MRKHVSVLVCAVLLGGSLTACGGSKKATGQSNAPLPTTVSQVSDASVQASDQLTSARDAVWQRQADIEARGFDIDSADDIDLREDGQPGLVVYGEFENNQARSNPTEVANYIQGIAGVPILVDGVLEHKKKRKKKTQWGTKAKAAVSKAKDFVQKKKAAKSGKK